MNGTYVKIKSDSSENGYSNSSSNNNDSNSQFKTVEKHAEDPKSLIPELCRHFYNLGWASGKISLNSIFGCSTSMILSSK